MTVLITAAYGNQGRRLVPKLAAQGVHVRGLRGHGPEAELLELGAKQAVVGDMRDPAVWRRAMEGVDTVYYIGPTLLPEETIIGQAAIDHARAAGVKHFILSSVMHPNIRELPHHVAKAQIEEHLLDSGLRFTVLRPASYMKVQVYARESQTGKVRRFWSMDTYEALVDLDDVTDVVARIIQDPAAHAGATYELAGDYLNGHEIAEVVSRATGRTVEPEEMSAETFLRAALKADPDDPAFAYQTRAVRAMRAWYGAHDFQGNSNVLRMLLGREPTTLEQAVRRAVEQSG